MLKWQASFHGFIAKSREKRPADKGKQLKQQVQYITTQMLLKGKQQITTQEDRKAAPTLLSFSKQPCFSSVIGL